MKNRCILWEISCLTELSDALFPARLRMTVGWTPPTPEAAQGAAAGQLRRSDSTRFEVRSCNCNCSCSARAMCEPVSSLRRR